MNNIYISIAVIILILGVLIWIYTPVNNSIRKQNVQNTIQWLYGAVNKICYRCNMSPIYEIIETQQITYTDKVTSTVKGSIYLVIWDEEHNRTFSHNTLMYAMLHEIAHILSPSIHHEPPFDSIESILINTAINLGYYDDTIPIESNYTTMDLTK